MANRQSKDGANAARLYFDVSDLKRSALFYERVLGFRVVGVYRRGLPYESWMLTRESHPGVMVVIRQSYRRPVVGSLPGGFTRLSLHEPDLAMRRAEIEKTVRVLPPSERAAPGGATAEGAAAYLEFLDPDGYVLELYSE